MGGIKENMLTYGSAMTKLSPAAQAVMDAVEDDCIHPTDLHRIAAAALRAAADRTECLIGDTPHPKFAEGVLAAGDLLQCIAAELEGDEPDL
jgi:hypothetical protein